MQDPWLLEMTASEPLSLDEERANQKSWRDDPTKCTFIILSQARLVSSSDTVTTDGTGLEARECRAMVGDVNFFLNDRENARNCEIGKDFKWSGHGHVVFIIG